MASWPPTAASKIKLDWPRVQAVKPGTPITVVLHKDRGPRGDRKVRGRFQSATDDSLTLKMEYGTARTLPKSAVRKVLVHRPKSNRVWSRVQAVEPGTRTKVILYKDQAPTWELRRIKGCFHSATEDSLTLTLDDGQTRTLQKSAVRKVLTRRPILKRWPGWVALGITLLMPLPEDVSWEAVFLVLPISAAFFYYSRMGEIYNVPRKHRTQPPADQPSGAKSKAPGKQGASQ